MDLNVIYISETKAHQTEANSKLPYAIVEDQVVQNLRKGAALAKLPRDHLGLQTVTVQLEHEITIRNASNQRISK